MKTKLAIILTLLSSTSAFADCIDFSGTYSNGNRTMVVAEDPCSEIHLNFSGGSLTPSSLMIIGPVATTTYGGDQSYTAAGVINAQGFSRTVTFPSEPGFFTTDAFVNTGSALVETETYHTDGQPDESTITTWTLVRRVNW